MRRLILAILVLGLFTAASCGKSGTGPVADPGAAPAVPGGWPAVSELADAAVREASYTETDLFKSADQYSDLLPPVGTTESGTVMVMAPHQFAGKEQQLGKLAYALYSFHLDAYDLEPTLDVDWVVAPGAPGNTFVALGNFDTERWDWFAAPAQGSPLTLPSFDPYIEGSTDILLVLVVVTGNDTLILSHLRVGGEFDEVEPNDGSGGIVNLLPSDDFADFTGSIGSGVGYPDYDGSDEDGFLLNVRPGDKLTFTLTYDSATADLEMELKDFAGISLATSSGSSPVILSKVLPGDISPPLQLYITAPMGYSDYSLEMDRQHAPSVRIAVSQWTGPALHSVNFSAAGTTDFDGSVPLQYEWDVEGDGTFELMGPSSTQWSYLEGAWRPVLRVTDDDGLISVLSTHVTSGNPTYNEVEHNDAHGGLAQLPTGQLSGFKGSIGADAGYPGYDGDDTDAYLLFPLAGQKFYVTVDYDPLTAPDMTLALFDSGLLVVNYGTQVAPGRIVAGAIAPANVLLPFLCSVNCTASGFSDYTLSKGAGYPPFAAISAMPSVGMIPLDTTLSAAGSADDGTIVKYEWDFNDDFVFDQDTGAVSSVAHNFGDAGNHVVRVRTTDDDGLQSTAQMIIYAGPVEYDEVEPNAFEGGEEVTLPDFPIASFMGSLGLHPTDGGYNGDHVDQFLLPQVFPPGTKLTFTITYNTATSDLSTTLRTPGGQYESSDSNTGTETIVHDVTGNETLPLYIDIRVDQGQYTDYELTVEVT